MGCVHHPCAAVGLRFFRLAVCDYDCFVICKQHHVSPFFHCRTDRCFRTVDQLHAVAVICSEFIRLLKLFERRMSRKDHIHSGRNHFIQKVQKFAEPLKYISIPVSIAEVLNPGFVVFIQN